MSGSDVDPDQAHDSSPWRPGAEVRFVHPPRRAFTETPDETRSRHREPLNAASQSPDTRRVAPPVRRRLAGGILVAVALVGGAVVAQGRVAKPEGQVAASAVRVSDDEVIRGRSSALRDVGGDVTLGSGDVPLLTATQCPAMRLPSAVGELWDVEIPDARRVVSPVTVSDDSVVAVVGFDQPIANGLPSVSVVAFDLDDGQERWRSALQPVTGGHEIVGVIDRAVIVRSVAGPDMAFRRLFAFDEDTGAVLWDRGFRGDWTAMTDASTGLVYVGVRRPAVSATEESEVEVLDPRTGDRQHIAAGTFVGLDPDGRLVTRLGDKVLATSIDDRDLLGDVIPVDSPFTVVGPHLVVADGAATELSVFSRDAEPRRFPLVGSTGIDDSGAVAYLESLGESALLVSGAGAVHGAMVGQGTVEIRWRVMGALLESAATDRGRSLVIATEGGAQQRVIDSSTGRTIVNLELRPGALTTLSLVANGVVTLGVAEGASVRVALDLDGRRLWTLPGRGPLAVGRGVVVDVTAVPVPGGDGTGFRLAAYGDPIVAGSEAAGCRSVMTEWIPR